ncbi:hypothetical protein K1T71_006143 [Dendrolimus kikuchii]|uniref:Uncharacterized protein n=1 Tax=Dendrolimus kikuchii TaxID=765133 RepID=A0ACC1D365_9NEOP|nr:hypothetical protein K1T71_006143 [Dendrolimus kikuchii]
MGEDRSVRKAYLGRPVGRRPVGRLKYRWKDRVEADLSELGASNWQETAQDRKKYNPRKGYIFELFGMESLGPCGPNAHQLFQNIKRTHKQETRGKLELTSLKA